MFQNICANACKIVEWIEMNERALYHFANITINNESWINKDPRIRARSRDSTRRDIRRSLLIYNSLFIIIISKRYTIFLFISIHSITSREIVFWDSVMYWFILSRNKYAKSYCIFIPEIIEFEKRLEQSNPY